MIIGLQIYFVLASVILFFYAIVSNKRAAYSFSYGVALNIFPLFFMPSVSMDTARLSGIPLAYFPIISAGFSLMIRSNIKIYRKHYSIILLGIVFLSYSLITTLYNRVSLVSIAYWMAWVINFLILFSAVSFFSKVNIKFSHETLRHTVLILVMGSIVGIFRYFYGISDDSNFMPAVNRNGTVIFVIMITPILFYMADEKIIGAKSTFLCFIIIMYSLILMQSRSGLLGLFLGVVLYFLKLSSENFIKIIGVAMLVAVFVVTGVANDSLDRLSLAVTTIQRLLSGDEFESSMLDYKRVMLLKSAISIISNNFWFGTGLGLENYRRAFHDFSTYDHDSKAHNFYLSYFAELGFVGFTIIIFFFVNAFKMLSYKYRAFKISFLVVAFAMSMNEYILLPEIWFFLGLMIGVSYKSNNLLLAKK